MEGDFVLCTHAVEWREELMTCMNSFNKVLKYGVAVLSLSLPRANIAMVPWSILA